MSIKFYNHLLLGSTLIFTLYSLHLHEASQDYIQYLSNQQNDLKQQIQNLQQKMSSNSDAISKQTNIDNKIVLLQAALKQQRLLLSDIDYSLINKQLDASEWVCPAIPADILQNITENIQGIHHDLQNLSNIIQPLNDSLVGAGIEASKKQISNTQKITDSLTNSLESKGQIISENSVNPELKSNINAVNWVLDGTKVDDLNAEYKKSADSGALKLCPSDAPFLSKDNTCIKCDGKNQYYSFRIKDCMACTNFDSSQHICKDDAGAKTNYNLISKRLIVPEGKTIDFYNTQEGDKTQCPVAKPFYTGTQCIDCPSFFNIDTKKCTTCEGNNAYNNSTHVCKAKVVYITNLAVGNQSLILPQDQNLTNLQVQNTNFKSSTGAIQCPRDKPFFNDYECISCANGTYFLFIQKNCGTCEQGRFFNSQTNHCENQSYYTNLDNFNWQSEKNISAIQTEVNSQASNPLYSKCPIDKPFSTGKECIVCGQSQHFDYDKKSCIKCPNGQFFSLNLHKCGYTQTNYQTNPQATSNLIFSGRAKNEWIYTYNKNIQQNPTMADCPKTQPYFDGQSCIVCSTELPYFNLQTKLCQNCPDGTQYNINHYECLTTQGNIVTQKPTLEKMAAGIFA